MRKPLSAALVAVVMLSGGLAGCRGPVRAAADATVKTDVGVTKEPCPKAVDKTKGCIYLGVLSDMTGPLAALGVPAADAVQAFWRQVNVGGGVGGKYEVDATTYVKDHKYNPQTANEVYQEVKDKVLALAASIGTPTTAAILPGLKANSVVTVPGGFSSGLLFEDVLVETGASYCVESMNDVDYARTDLRAKSVMAVHWPGDYGDDSAGGIRYAAAKQGLTFTDVGTGPGQDKQAGAISAILAGKPDVVILATGPAEAAVIVGGAVAQGFKGTFIGLGPTWLPQLNQSPAAPALAAAYLQSQAIAPFNSDTPGHKAMREALGTPKSINDVYTTGWAASYPLKAALEKALADADLTRKGLLDAVRSLTSVDYQGMLPSDAGNFKAGPAGQVKQSFISKPDKAAPTGVTLQKTIAVGPTAQGFTPTKPCYEK